MNGAEALIRALIAGGIDICFTNPGTSEMHMVAALDRNERMRCILGLFEGVVTGAADGYARMSEKPACTLLHLGPGLANGLANLHNASRAYVPIVNIVGQHAVDHLRHDSPLRSDIEGVARPYSKWIRTSRAVAEISRDTTDAIIAANTPPGQIATLIVPANVAWEEISSPQAAAYAGPAKAPLPGSESLARAAGMLRSGLRTAIILAGRGLYGKGLATAGRIASATGAKLLSPYPFTRMQRGAGAPIVDRMHYVPAQAVEQLKEFRQIILVGAPEPVSYFAYPGRSSLLSPPECEIHALAAAADDCAGALESLAKDLDLSDKIAATIAAGRPLAPSGEITPQGIASAVAALLPENAIVVDESMTSGRGLMAATRNCPNHDWLANTGGSIGIAMPLAVGAAVACPDRRVLCLSADGSGMYTAQALWTMARERLPVTTVIFANRAYAVLKREFSSLGTGEPSPRASALFDLTRPNLDWVSLAQGMGVKGTRVTSLDSLVVALREGFLADGPTLIEVAV